MKIIGEAVMKKINIVCFNFATLKLIINLDL